MIYGDQWLCPCGWYNLFLRSRCRNCGGAKLPDEKTESIFAVLQDHPVMDDAPLPSSPKATP